MKARQAQMRAPMKGRVRVRNPHVARALKDPSEHPDVRVLAGLFNTAEPGARRVLLMLAAQFAGLRLDDAQDTTARGCERAIRSDDVLSAIQGLE